MEKVELVEHDCPVEGPIMTESGKPCNWCDQLDDVEDDQAGDNTSVNTYSLVSNKV